MSRLLSLWAVFAVLVASGVAVGGEAGEAARLCEFDRLTAVLTVEGGQLAAMNRTVATLGQKLRAWDVANAKTLADITAQLTAARKKRDMTAMIDLLARQTSLKAARQTLINAARADLLKQLTVSQRTEWESFLLFDEMHARFKPLTLSEQQVSDIRTRCRAAGATIAGLLIKGRSREAGKARQTLQAAIVADVLTDAQRQAHTGKSPRRAGAKAGETEAQRRKRVALAVAGWTGKRQAADQDKGAKDTAAGMNARIASGAGGVLGKGGGRDKGADASEPKWRVELRRLINEARAKEGLAALPANNALNAAAQTFAGYMRQTGKFSHDADGRSPTARAKAAGYAGGVGENIAMSGAGPQRVFDMWMNSPGHRANILGKNYRCLGLGKEGSYWVACFGMK